LSFPRGNRAATAAKISLQLYDGDEAAKSEDHCVVCDKTRRCVRINDPNKAVSDDTSRIGPGLCNPLGNNILLTARAAQLEVKAACTEGIEDVYTRCVEVHLIQSRLQDEARTKWGHADGRPESGERVGLQLKLRRVRTAAGPTRTEQWGGGADSTGCAGGAGGPRGSLRTWPTRQSRRSWALLRLDRHV